MRTAYDVIYRDLRREIEDGTYAYEDFLPSQSELVRRYGCAHNTVRRALSMLADQGYCQPIHGKGVRVLYRPNVTEYGGALFETGGVETFDETAARNMFDAKTRVLLFEYATCTKELARTTGFEEGGLLLHVERVRELNGRALIHDKSYFRAGAVDGLTPEQATRSIYAYIEDVIGLRIATSKRTITVEDTTEEDRAWLDVDDYDLLAVIHRRTFDGDGIQFEYTQSRHHPKYFCFHDVATRRRVA